MIKTKSWMLATLTIVSSLLPLLPLAVVCCGLPAVLGSLLYWTLLSFSVAATFLSFPDSSSSVTTRLSVALPPLFVSVPVVMVLAGFFDWFGMADLFPRRRAGFGLRLWAFVLV